MMNSKCKRFCFPPGLLFLYLILRVSVSYSNEIIIPETRDADRDTLLHESIVSDSTDMVVAPQYWGPHQLAAEQPFVQQSIKRDYTSNYITGFILLTLLLMGLARFLFPLRFKETLLASWDTRYFNQMEREGGLLNHWVSFFLYINYLVSISLLINLSIFRFAEDHLTIHLHPLLLLLYGVLSVAIFYFLKYLIMIFAAWMFDTQKTTESYFRQILVVNKISGVVLLPILILYFFNAEYWILILAWIVFASLILFRVVKSSFIGLRISGFSTYHLILYLCTVEIAPLLFLIKYALNLVQTG